MEAKKKKRRSDYIMLEQVGFLDEKPVTPDTDLSCCPDKLRVLEDSEEAFIAIEDGPRIPFVPAPPDYTGAMAIDESKTRLREVRSDFHAIILKAQAPIKLNSKFLLILTITDPHALETDITAECWTTADIPEYLPFYHIGDVLRIHRRLLGERAKDGKHLTISATSSVAAWVIFDQNGNVRSESGSTRSMTAFEESLLNKYIEFAKTLFKKTWKGTLNSKCARQVQEKVQGSVPKNYAILSEGIFVPALDSRLVNENDLTSVPNMLDLIY